MDDLFNQMGDWVDGRSRETYVTNCFALNFLFHLIF